MSIHLPRIKPEYSLLRKFGTFLFNWFAWIVPAAHDMFALDIGPDYQSQVALVVSFNISALVTISIFGLYVFHMPILWYATSMAATYLLFGSLYHWNELAWR